MLLFYFVGPSAHPEESPLDEVEHALWGGDDVEGGRDGPALLEVRDPQLAPRELPFDVGFFLRVKN